MKQSQIFLKSEGDAWFHRNEAALLQKNVKEDDLIVQEVLKITEFYDGNIKILEVGCGDGFRLEWLNKNINATCFGIEPSKHAVDIAVKKGIFAKQGTAEILPFESNSIDIIIFGFCLYLCDREDLFRIASEANRVCKNQGWIIIYDFYSSTFNSNEYHHYDGIKSYKMDYRSLFTWHPYYECTFHNIISHKQPKFIDERDEWTAISNLRKNYL